MQGYEITVIFNAVLNDSELEKLLTKVRSWIGDNQGKIHHEVAWGRKKLAYKINKKAHGYYHLLYVTGTGEMLNELKLQCSYDIEILKIFIVKTKELQSTYDHFQLLLNNPTMNEDLYKQSETNEE